jgi:hypothetical protein
MLVDVIFGAKACAVINRPKGNITYVPFTHVKHQQYVTRFEPLHPMHRLHQTEQKGKSSSIKSRWNDALAVRDRASVTLQSADGWMTDVLSTAIYNA